MKLLNFGIPKEFVTVNLEQFNESLIEMSLRDTTQGYRIFGSSVS